MASLIDLIVARTDCRTPLCVHHDIHEPGPNVEALLERASTAQGISLVCFRLDYPDDEPRMFRALDQAQYNGDWLLVMIAPVSDTGDSPLNQSFIQELLRKIARRQYATMPKDSSSSMELCRLWINLPWKEDVIPLPAIFKQISETAILVPDDAFRSAVDGQTSGNKLGPLFYRRLERVKGQQPQGTSVVHVRPKTVDVAAREIPTLVQKASSVPDDDPQKQFEALAAETVQKLYERLLRANATSAQGASRLMREAQLLSSTETEARVGREDGLTWCNASDISIGAVMYRSTSSGATCVVRQGQWRGITVSIHHYSTLDYDKLLPSLQLQFQARHPFMVSPWSVAKGEDNQGFYVVMPLAPVGPSALSFRTLVSLSTSETDFRYSKSVDCQGPNSAAQHQSEEAALGLMRSVASMGSCVASALLSLHKDGILHCDVNIQNVFDFGNGVYKLVLTPRARYASLGSDVVTSDGIALRWSSPEALSRCSYSASDDVYGLGILMWEALTGAHHAPLAHLVSTDDAVRAIVEGAKPPRPAHCDSSFWDHIVAPCFAAAQYRPALRHLIECLTDYLHSDVFTLPLGVEE